MPRKPAPRQVPKPVGNRATLAVSKKLHSKSQSASPTPRQTIPWHDVPEEVRVIIYNHYFATSTYTIHDTNYTSVATIPSVSIVDTSPAAGPSTDNIAGKCPTHPALSSKDKFWQQLSTLSSTVHASHIKLFLVEPKVIQSAHSIWLAKSTFQFAGCITRALPSIPIHYHSHFNVPLDPNIDYDQDTRPTFLSTLSDLPVPTRRLGALRRLECNAGTVLNTIGMLGVLARWAAEDSRNSDVDVKREFTIVYRGAKREFSKMWAGKMLREEKYNGELMGETVLVEFVRNRK